MVPSRWCWQTLPTSAACPRPRSYSLSGTACRCQCAHSATRRPNSSQHRHRHTRSYRQRSRCPTERHSLVGKTRPQKTNAESKRGEKRMSVRVLRKYQFRYCWKHCAPRIETNDMCMRAQRNSSSCGARRHVTRNSHVTGRWMVKGIFKYVMTHRRRRAVQASTMTETRSDQERWFRCSERTRAPAAPATRTTSAAFEQTWFPFLLSGPLLSRIFFSWHRVLAVSSSVAGVRSDQLSLSLHQPTIYKYSHLKTA